MQIREYMTNDHRECDEIFAKVEELVGKKDFEAAKEAFKSFKERTLHHFKQEEEFLFVEFTKATGMVGGPVEVMTYEHNQMRAIFENMQNALDSGNANEFFGFGESMMILLQQHNMKEEQMLYNMIQMHLDSRNDQIVQQLQEMQNLKGYFMESLLVFDTRDLAHPEPLEIMTKALCKAQYNKILKMIHHREPFPLYELIKAANLEYRTFKQEDDFVIYIGKKDLLDKFLAC